MISKKHRMEVKIKFGFASGMVSLLLAQSAWAWPDLKVAKTGPAQVARGGLITCSLTCSDIGQVKSAGVVLTDFLPPCVTALTNTLGGGSLSGNTIYKLNENWTLFDGMQFQSMGEYSHREGGREAVLDMGGSAFVAFGAGISF